MEGRFTVVVVIAANPERVLVTAVMVWVAVIRGNPLLIKLIVKGAEVAVEGGAMKLEIYK